MRKLLSFALLVLCLGTADAQYTVLNSFNDANLDVGSMARPEGSLTPSTTGDTLFGMTYWGGKYTTGSVYYITDNGSVYDTVVSFYGANGANPTYNNIIVSGNVLYGMTPAGGANNVGLVFSVHTDGTGFTDLHDFAYVGWGYDGKYPQGSLVLSNGVLFGMTERGGLNGKGNAFRINTDGSHFDTLHSFAYIAEDGREPFGSLTISGNVLYGMTYQGGQHGAGVIFSFDTNGSNYDTLHSFGNNGDGGLPYGDLLLSGNVLYGITAGAGLFGYGNIFSIHTDGTAYDTLHNFGNGADGYDADGSLILVNNVLFGTTQNGQIGGSIFSIHTDGTAYDSSIYNFPNGSSLGSEPNGNLVYNKGVLYGVTFGGGVTGYGVIFSDSIPYITTTHTQGAMCYTSSNGNATAVFTGSESPYTYSWSNGGTTVVSMANPSGNVLSAGIYTVTVTDNRHISTTASAVITSPAALASSNYSGASEAAVTESGGVSPYTYFWTPGAAITDTIKGLSAGTYTCTITDVNGCTTTTAINVTATGINGIANASVGVTIYPNPSIGIFTVQSSVSSRDLTVSVYNLLGEQVYANRLNLANGGDFKVDLTNQPDGIYFIRIANSEGNIVTEQKLLKNK